MAPAGGAVSVRHASSANAPGPDDVNPETEESCPVCKSSRYFNKDLEFLINPECYHRMCKNCVNRIFKEGPNQCPYAGCHKTLRLRGFKNAFFSDLRVEREVDIRRRVANVFNKVEEDFETLEDYNDYLYKVECLTDDLVNGKDDAKRKAETELIDWEAQHKAEIDRNKRLARESDDARQKRIAFERDAARHRRMEELEAEAEEKANAARFREEMLDSLQSAEDGQAAQAVNKVMLKRRGQQKRDSAMDTMAGASGLSIRYSPDEFISRALYEAFAGLGVFIGEEKMEKGVGTMGAMEAAQTGVTAGSMDVDDPF
ncbi:CDK-activating kinase assembly factor [Sarocladium strictum]